VSLQMRRNGAHDSFDFWEFWQEITLR
jgi:hypothetical protein